MPEQVVSEPDKSASVGFRAPSLTAISEHRKLIDMRLASDPDTRRLRVGQVIRATQASAAGLAVVYLRITVKRHFATPAEAYVTFQSEGTAGQLFPYPEFSMPDGKPVFSPNDADSLYATYFRRGHLAWQECGVHTFGVEVVWSSLWQRHSQLSPPSVKQVSASKVIFSHFNQKSQSHQYWTHFRARGGLDALGGMADPVADGAPSGPRPDARVTTDDLGRATSVTRTVPAFTAARELGEEAELPQSWVDAAALQLAAHPEGHAHQVCRHPSREEEHCVHVWVVPLTHSQAQTVPTLTADGETEVAPDSSEWRDEATLDHHLWYATAFQTARSVAHHGSRQSSDGRPQSRELRRRTIAVLIRRQSQGSSHVACRQLSDGTWELPHVEVTSTDGPSRRQAAESLIASSLANPSATRAASANIQWTEVVVAGHKAVVACTSTRAPFRTLEAAKWHWVPEDEAPNMPSLPSAMRVAVGQALAASSSRTRDRATKPTPWTGRSAMVAAAVSAPDEAFAVRSVDLRGTMESLIETSRSGHRDQDAAVDQRLMERILHRARARARGRGSRSVDPRDVADAADELRGKSNVDSPAVIKPQHWSELLQELARLRHLVVAMRESGQAPPRVLVTGEKNGVVASMFVKAGAEVATCDLEPTATPHIPHFQGDAAYVQDLGWDLVIAHPPCTYLSNAGVSWLYKDPARRGALLDNAAQYRAMAAAKAPFKAVENPVMNRWARKLVRRGQSNQVQYVHPWQHGTGHTKPTGLDLFGLPPLRPTCVVDGREHAMARLPPSPDRAEKRSRTYLGIGGAMATQWMPVLLTHVRNQEDRDTRRAIDLVREAERAINAPQQCHVTFSRSTATGRELLCYRTKETGAYAVCSGSIEEGERYTESAAAARVLKQQLYLPPAVQREVESALEVAPFGHAFLPGGFDPKLGGAESHRIWVVPLDDDELSATVALKPHPTAEPGSLRWYPIDTVLGGMSSTYSAPTRAAVRSTAMAAELDQLPATLTRRQVIGAAPVAEPVDTPTLSSGMPRTTRPWEYALPEPTVSPQAPREIRFRHGKWRVWRPTTCANTGSGEAQWEPLPPSLDEALKNQLLPSRMAVPDTVMEEISVPWDETVAALSPLSPERCSWTQSGKPPNPFRVMSVPQQSLIDSIRQLWSQPKPIPLVGIGATADTPRRTPWSRHSRGQKRADAVRNEHQRWVSPATSTDVAVVDLDTASSGPIPNDDTPETGTGDNGDNEADTAATEPSGVFVVSNDEVLWSDAWSSRTVASAAHDTQTDEVTVTPTGTVAYPHTSLFVLGLTVKRFSQTRQRSGDQVYAVPHSMAVSVERALADTGAGPSIITTELLAALPNDCVIRRQVGCDCPPLTGPNGKLLVSRGTAVVQFAVNGSECQHEFRVVDGAPLLLLGNDFLVPRKAVIDTVHGRVRLESPVGQTGRVKQHDFAVSHQPASAGGEVNLVTESAGATGASDSVTGDTAATDGSASTGGVHVVPLPGLGPPPKTTSEATDAAFERVTRDHLLYCDKAVRVPPRSKAVVWVRAPLELSGRGEVSVMVERLPFRQGLEDPPLVETMCCTLPHDGKLPVVVWNKSSRATTIPSFSPLASIESEFWVHAESTEEGEEGTGAYALLNAEERKLIDSVDVDPDKILSVEQTVRVRDMLAKHVSVFAKDPKDPGKTHLMEVELPLKPDAAPHRHAASRLGEKGREIVEQHCSEMESRGIIRKSNSSWASRVVLVGKKDGSVRFCVDYRDTNSKLLIQDSPVPLTVEALDRLGSGEGPIDSLFLSTLDLASGFWCLPIKEEDKGITAFVTHRQKYEFNYLPFGVQCGPSYMCRLMDAALSGLAWEVCMPYLDDVGCWSTGSGDTQQERSDASFEQMLYRLNLVLERLKWAGLTCKASKCVLFATSAEYLGHIMSRDGLKMDPKKISTIRDIDPTTICTLEKVRSFLGLCSYYRRFIRDFAQIASPLNELTKVGVDVGTMSQEPKCQEAIKMLQESITSEPVLTTPRFDREFILKTDGAQTEGIGAVLSQKDDEGHEKVIGFYGRRLKDAERNYTVTEIELLAAVEAIKNWRAYLWGRQFRLIVDHAALKWLHSMKDTMEGGPASRLMRWILKLSEYRFTIEHKPGVQHKDADGVSRLVAAVFGSTGDFASDDTENLVANVAAGGVRASQERTAARAKVLTARRKQDQDRQERNENVTRADVVQTYLSTGAPSAAALRAAQEADTDCQALRRFLETGNAGEVSDSQELRRAQWIAEEGRHLEIHDDTLMRVIGRDVHNPDAGIVPYVPADMRHPIMTAFHDHMGHLGNNHVSKLIRGRFYWPAMHQDIADHCHECHECTLGKRPPRRVRDPKGVSLGSYPFDVLVCDILSLAPTHDFVKGQTGYDKLMVFVDSLSRWVEAIPCNGDPSSEQVLDAFMTHVVSRHGAPRRVISDQGSNLASQLTDSILEQTGVDLRPSTAEHHETVGSVERFHMTLQNMIRTSDEGGQHWCDHLPFLLMSYRATPHRVTGLSPAELLYGRELRLPQQMDQLGHSVPPVECTDAKMPAAVLDYARRLHQNMVYAWAAARGLSLEAQERAKSHTQQTSRVHQFKVGDRVCRLLYGNANNLKYFYAGPYRVKAVLEGDRYQLCDLENNLIHDEFNVANLRPYRTHVDAEALANDEYVVDYLLDMKGRGADRKFLVKWRQYPRNQATWEPRANLMDRCEDDVLAMEAAKSAAAQPTRAPTPPTANEPADAPDEEEEPALRPAPPQPLDPAPRHVPRGYESDENPSVAKLTRGAWTYGRFVATPRGKQLRWFAESAFPRNDLDSNHFQNLRNQAIASSHRRDRVASCCFK